MGSALHDVLGTDVHDVAADGAGGVEGQGLVLVDGEGVQLPLVDGSLIHCPRHRGVDQLAVRRGDRVGVMKEVRVETNR